VIVGDVPHRWPNGCDGVVQCSVDNGQLDILLTIRSPLKMRTSVLFVRRNAKFMVCPHGQEGRGLS